MSDKLMEDFIRVMREVAGDGSDCAWIDGVLEAICCCYWDRDGFVDIGPVSVSVCHAHMINATNYVLEGSVIVSDDLCYDFVAESGDNNGFYFIDFGQDISPYEKPEPDPMVLVPEDNFLVTKAPHMFRVYLEWRKAGWFNDMQGKYNYDRTFSPGSVIEEHYRGAAKKRGLKFVRQSYAREMYPEYFGVQK